MTAIDTNIAASFMRVLRQAVRPPHLRRFWTAVHEDGWRLAIAKARHFLGMQWRGSAHTVLREKTDSSQKSPQYLHGIWQELARGNAFHVNAPRCDTNHRFVAIIGDLNLPQCRKYRVEQLAGFWHAQDIACEFAHYEDLPRVTRLLSLATHLVEYRLPATPLTEMLRYEARRLRLPILYDIDDPLFSVSAYETYGNMNAIDPMMKQHFVARAPRYMSMMNGADLISVSTPGLAQHAALYSSRPIHVRRNFADPVTLTEGARARARRPARDGAFRVAFASGSKGHEVDLAEIVDVIEPFIMAAPKRRLLMLGHINKGTLPKALLARTDAMPFSTYEAYLAALARADCALMPLANDLFNQCKSAVRVIDAAAVSVPSIVGPVGDMASMITHGETGYIAQNPEDWLTYLNFLTNRPDRATQIGEAARQTLETEWSGQASTHIIDPEILEWVKR
ncbi:MAG: glycosyltransferase [Tateyamaria sp.]|uniref:glycosyltransferase family protein n=1 Tax=Tateyamaria sp. TaxID=1929288 RepID=UPI00328DC9E1